MPLGRRALRSGYQSLIIVAALIGAPDAQRYGVPPVNAGRVDMPTSCKGEAQAEFERGAALLHSFWYDEARHAFTAA
ncbi:MAG: hypothetical protein HYX76_01435, partial [Acidobacteria bacterium]|nr:hypothetical protein [Acidobacteriota bacterium]